MIIGRNIAFKGDNRHLNLVEYINLMHELNRHGSHYMQCLWLMTFAFYVHALKNVSYCDATLCMMCGGCTGK
jgi:hypothetical protein